MVLLMQPSITGVPFLWRGVDRLLVVPRTEIRTDGVRPSQRGEGRCTGLRLGHATGVHRRRAQRRWQGLSTGLIGAETVTAEAWAPWV